MAAFFVVAAELVWSGTGFLSVLRRLKACTTDSYIVRTMNFVTLAIEYGWI